MKKVRKYWWRNDRNAASEVSGKPQTADNIKASVRVPFVIFPRNKMHGKTSQKEKTA